MAKVKLNPILEQLSGKVGDLVFKKYVDKTVIAAKADRSGVEPTEAQLAHRQPFQFSVLFEISH